MGLLKTLKRELANNVLLRTSSFPTFPSIRITVAELFRYQAASIPVDLEQLKIREDEEIPDEAEDEDEEVEEEEEDDAALEDVKDLYQDDDEGTGKKRKRAPTDNGEKAGKKKVLHLPDRRLIAENFSSGTKETKTQGGTKRLCRAKRT